jgi:hypothetical protein
MAFYTNTDSRLRVKLRTRLTCTPISLVGATLEVTFKKSLDDDSTALLLTTGNGGIVLTKPAKGIFEMVLTTQQVTALGVGRFIFDIVRPDDGRRNLLGAGTIKVSEAVS